MTVCELIDELNLANGDAEVEVTVPIAGADAEMVLKDSAP